jgi:hypothetical protein
LSFFFSSTILGFSQKRAAVATVRMVRLRFTTQNTRGDMTKKYSRTRMKNHPSVEKVKLKRKKKKKVVFPKFDALFWCLQSFQHHYLVYVYHLMTLHCHSYNLQKLFFYFY